MQLRPTITVLGGGPAGASAAKLLASWGHTVRIITRPAHQRIAVSLPPSCSKLFGVLGIAAAIERAGFTRSTGNTVWWGAAAARVEMFAGGALGWQVDLARLEAVLLDAAAAEGVTIERETIPAHARVFDGADFVLDCTGRAGIIARARNLRRYHHAPTTIALAGAWQGAFAALEDASHTVIESYADGWMWSVPIRKGLRHVSAMIDPQRSDLARAVAARQVYLTEIAKTRAFARLLSGATLIEGPSGWDASTYFAEQYAGDKWLLVGDAGSFIDPLSSAGVKKALASAWLAAVVVNTCLRTPQMAPHARDLFSDREREIERRYTEESRLFLSNAARGHDRPFWAERATDVSDAAVDSQAVRHAYDQLRRADSLDVKPAAHVRIEPRPLIDGNEIRLAPHVVGGDTAVRFIEGVDLVTLLELAPRAAQVPDLFETYNRNTRPVPLHDFLVALSSAVARGWLVRQ